MITEVHKTKSNYDTTSFRKKSICQESIGKASVSQVSRLVKQVVKNNRRLVKKTMFRAQADFFALAPFWAWPFLLILNFLRSNKFGLRLNQYKMFGLELTFEYLLIFLVHAHFGLQPQLGGSLLMLTCVLCLTICSFAHFFKCNQIFFYLSSCLV